MSSTLLHGTWFDPRLVYDDVEWLRTPTLGFSLCFYQAESSKHKKNVLYVLCGWVQTSARWCWARPCSGTCSTRARPAPWRCSCRTSSRSTPCCTSSTSPLLGNACPSSYGHPPVSPLNVFLFFRKWPNEQTSLLLEIDYRHPYSLQSGVTSDQYYYNILSYSLISLSFLKSFFLYSNMTKPKGRVIILVVYVVHPF